jgi:hypothetical protein
VGGTTLRNLLAGGFKGPIHIVNRKYPEIEGIKCLPNIDGIPGTPDLTIISTPPSAIESIIRKIGARNFPSAMVLSGGLGLGTGSYTEAIAQAARKSGVRLIGPSLGILVPHINQNASFASRMPQAGELALISQPAKILTSTLATCSTISRSTPRRGRSCSTSNPLPTCASSCPPHARQRASNPSSSSNRDGTGRARARRPHIPARWRDRMPSTVRHSGARACCA